MLYPFPNLCGCKCDLKQTSVFSAVKLSLGGEGQGGRGLQEEAVSVRFGSEEGARLPSQGQLSWKTHRLLTGSSASGDHTLLLVHRCKYHIQKTRMPRSRSGSVSEHFSLKRLRPLFLCCTHPWKTTATPAHRAESKALQWSARLWG